MKQENILRFVGVTGLPGAGKGVFIDLLQKQLQQRDIDNRYYSLSDVLRDEARNRNLPIERPQLRKIANALRLEHGSGVLSLMVTRKLRHDLQTLSLERPLVIIIDAIRNPEEVMVLREELGDMFVLVGVEAPLEVLVARIAERARFDEPAEFVQQKEAARRMILGESGQDEPAHGHNIARCISLADWRVDNSETIDTLAEETERFIDEMIPDPAG